MMIKIAIVLCAVMATTMVLANDVEEQALADLLGLLAEEVSAPDNTVASQGWFKRAMDKVRQIVHKAAGIASGACHAIGQSPEEARAKILEAFPHIKEADLDDMSEDIFCKFAHLVNHLGR